ncbi:hypothetical protein MVES1_000428 [Malassezia vespertilionis]|uniref:uncharacterized protein n=1 Tax=Malassezia vespertilionis TaxID=2020962 RepID=UPI0024B0BD5D|nr:uncharacterized protein MVES1_000428 [Malassezia vespertilionis]WFD05102.1 hypothetical protein MVES1_000428 [Malassezia vespertilionis]
MTTKETEDAATIQVTDPALLASILPRIRRIAQILQEVQQTEVPKNELETTETAPAEHVWESAPQSTSLALGAVADDEDMDMWAPNIEQTGARYNHVPPELLARLAQEATELRAVFAKTRDAIRATPGANISVASQESLLSTVESYVQQQNTIRKVWEDWLPTIAQADISMG